MSEERPFIFKDGGTELILPVTPSSYKIENGVNIEVVNIYQLGDVIMTGYGTLATILIRCMFPANSYPFALDDDPVPYIDQFQQWVEAKRRIRHIIGGTGVNIPVKVQSFSFGEEDGTNDVYADITLRQHRSPEAIQLTTVADNTQREAPETTETSATVQSYTIVADDTLSAICHKYYGDASANTYNRLAQYNGISNPHLIYAGNTLKIPKPLP